MKEAIAPPPLANASHTRWLLAAYYGLAAVWGIRSLYQEKESRLDVLVPLAMAVALGWWAIADARRRGGPIPLLARPWFFLAFGILVPGYTIWSRGWRGAGWVILHAVAWYALAAVTMYGTWATGLVGR